MAENTAKHRARIKKYDHERTLDFYKDPIDERAEAYRKLCLAVLHRAMLDYHLCKRAKRQRASLTILGIDAKLWILDKHDSAVTIHNCIEALSWSQGLEKFQAMCMSEKTGDALAATWAFHNPHITEMEAEMAALKDKRKVGFPMQQGLGAIQA